jgi:hypothetical protein
MGIDFSDFGALGKYGAIIVLSLGNLAFVLYDIAVSKMALVYIWTIAPKLKKILK